MHKIPTIFFLTLLTTACGGGGTGNESPTAGHLTNDAESQATSNAIPSNNTSNRLTGYYSIVATPSQQTITGSTNYFCNSGVGEFAVYEGRVSGWASGYGISASVNNTGSINGHYTVGSTPSGSFIGSVNGQTGNGTFADSSSPCGGTWTATKISYPATSNGTTFTLTPNNYPASLKFKFVPTSTSSNNAVACETSIGVIDTDGRVSIGSSGVTYNGYAKTTQGYRTDVQLKLNPDSGAVEGTFEYDPLGIYGSIVGDLYYGEVERTYSNGSSSANAGCNGTWMVTTVDRNFSEVPADTNTNTNTNTNNVPVSPPTTSINHSNSIPYCHQASERIIASVNPGMTAQQVLEAVGKPLRITGLYGTDWAYNTYSTPSIDFGYSNGTISTVEGYDADDIYCASNYTRDNSLIAAANSLALNTPIADYTNEVPTCLDAATRILAYIQHGMTPAQVRQKVGKPLEINGLYGTDWQYGSYGISVDFGYSGGTIATVEGYSVTNHSSCQ